MNDLLAHRGPDDDHVYVGNGVALAARRLSIIDLAGGRQPLSNEDGTVWITYNGELFNAPGLRHELEQLGHVFQTHTDTEVIVHAYEEWGSDAVVRLRGMFAFAIWDVPRRRLLAARDRFGIKPLYFARSGPRFACASEIKPLFAALPELARTPAAEALWHLFEVGFVPTPLTAFEHIAVLPAAHLLMVERGEVSVRRYWELAYPLAGSIRSLDRQTATGQFMHHLREAMKAWMMSDVPVGSLLSGGIDSSTLAYLLTELSGAPIHTFNIAFDSTAHDESALARATAAMLQSHHHELRFTQDDFNHLPALIRFLETPQTSATNVPIFLLYKACREAGFKVIMTGEGADELLGGYHWFDGDRRVRQLLSLPQPLRRVAARLPLPVSAAGRRVLERGSADPVARYALWQQVSPPRQRRSLLRQTFPGDILAIWRPAFAARLGELTPLDQFLLLDTETRMVDFINLEVDRMSMANSVEARPPFLDHRLWEFVLGLPADFKLTPGNSKQLLRDGMRGLVPDAVRRQPKKGLASPHASWWRQEKLPTWAESALAGTALAETGYFVAETVRHLREAHRTGRNDYSRVLTGVLTTQLWHDQMDVRS